MRFRPLIAVIAACAGGTWAACCMAEAPAVVRPSESLKARNDDPQKKPPVITSVAVSPGGAHLATAGDDHVVRVWSTSSGEIVHKLNGHRDWIRSLAFSPDGALLASAGDDHLVTLWHAEAGERLAELPRHPHVVYAIAFSPDGKKLAAVGFESKVRIYDVAGLKLDCELDGPDADLRAIAYSPDGQRLAAAGRNANIRIWHAADGKPLRDIAAGPRRIRSLGWLPDGESLVSAGEGKAVSVWNTTSGEQLKTLHCQAGKVLSMAVCGENLIATGGSDNLIRIWNWQTQTLADQLQGHTGSVASLAFDKTSGTIISGSYDTTVRVWRLPGGSKQGTTAAGTEETSRIR